MAAVKDDALQMLKADIKAQGILEPIIAHDNAILDEKNRYLINSPHTDADQRLYSH